MWNFGRFELGNFLTTRGRILFKWSWMWIHLIMKIENHTGKKKSPNFTNFTRKNWSNYWKKEGPKLFPKVFFLGMFEKAKFILSNKSQFSAQNEDLIIWSISNELV